MTISAHDAVTTFARNNHGYPWYGACSCGYHTAGYVAEHAAATMIADHINNAPAPTVLETLTSEYGDYWEKSISHVVDRYTGYYGDLITISLACEYDPHGYENPVCVSNYRTLLDSWGELECWHASPYPKRLVTLELAAQAPADLIDIIDALSDYPILDESRWSEVEQDMIAEHYELYGRADIIRELEKRVDIDPATHDLDPVIDSLVWQGLLDYGPNDGYPTMIDASACDFGTLAVVDFIVAHAGTVATIDHYGELVEVDLTALKVIA